jgi:phosphoesterase RecJ-like protein
LRESKRFADCIGKKVLIVGHQNADADAVGAAQGVKELIRTLNPSADVEIVMPENTNKLASNVASALGLEIVTSETIEGADTLVIVDTGGISQLGDWWNTVNRSDTSIIFIDHHLPDSEILHLSNLYVLDPDASSTSEMVYELMKTYDIIPSRVTASALLAGIAFDTRHFSMGGARTFRAISELLEVTGDVSDIKDLLSLPMSSPEKIARLKACRRAEITQSDEWIIATSRLSSFQSSGARALVSLGADLAIVAGKVNGDVRASMRSTTQFYRSTMLHLGDFTYELAKTFDGSGSGHPTAAGIRCPIDLDSFFKVTMKRVEEELTLRN